MRVEGIHVQIMKDADRWKLGVAAIIQGGQVQPYVGTAHERTRRRYLCVSDAMVSARHLVNDILGEPPSRVPGVPVDRWNRDGDVPADKLTGGAA